MLIKNLKIYTIDGSFRDGELAVANGIFVQASSQQNEEIFDGQGLYAIPGLVDLHLHGALGGDASDGFMKALEKMASYELSQGVTSICPTTMTIPLGELKVAIRTIKEFANKNVHHASRILGINMEGPFISPVKKGAQKEQDILKADVGIFQELNDECGGMIKLVDLAPEMDGSLEFIVSVKDKVRISLAHTNASYEEASKAFAIGAKHVTHLYNAMPPLHHREPGVIGAAFDSADVKCELIVDGVHSHPSVVRASFALFGYERIILISDSMRATGLADGEYTLGGQKVVVKGNEARLEDGTIAGSVTNLMNCLRKAVQFGIPLGQAVYSASTNPAIALGVDDELGSLDVGKIADFVLLDEDLNIKAVYLAGEKI
ncbi:MAG: N-acetylglucosamine-6-phosphate deacetylase [Phascolarctobacterium sp.]|nr:N-acetylglucosamine-6-phosphate deacetylase [Phascolarctobacterium sp.]